MCCREQDKNSGVPYNTASIINRGRWERIPCSTTVYTTENVLSEAELNNGGIPDTIESAINRGRYEGAFQES